jgi:hypothetical protein
MIWCWFLFWFIGVHILFHLNEIRTDDAMAWNRAPCSNFNLMYNRGFNKLVQLFKMKELHIFLFIYATWPGIHQNTKYCVKSSCLHRYLEDCDHKTYLWIIWRVNSWHNLYVIRIHLQLINNVFMHAHFILSFFTIWSSLFSEMQQFSAFLLVLYEGLSPSTMTSMLH